MCVCCRLVVSHLFGQHRRIFFPANWVLGENPWVYLENPWVFGKIHEFSGKLLSFSEKFMSFYSFAAWIEVKNRGFSKIYFYLEIIPATLEKKNSGKLNFPKSFLSFLVISAWVLNLLEFLLLEFFFFECETTSLL